MVGEGIDRECVNPQHARFTQMIHAFPLEISYSATVIVGPKAR